MKQIKNKQNQFGSPILAGYSDKRVHGIIMLSMVTVLILTPPIGFIASVFFVSTFGLFIALKAAEYQNSHYRSELLYRQAMDQIYYGSMNARYYKKMLNRYKSPSQIKRLNNAKAFNSVTEPGTRSTKVLSLQLDN